MFKIYDIIKNVVIDNDSISINKKGEFFLNGLELSRDRYAVSWNLFIKDSNKESLYTGDIVKGRLYNAEFKGCMSTTHNGDACVIVEDLIILLNDSSISLEKVGNIYEGEYRNFIVNSEILRSNV